MPEPCWSVERWKPRPDGEMNRPRERSDASKQRYGVRDKVQAPIRKQARGREHAAHTYSLQDRRRDFKVEQTPDPYSKLS